MGQSGGYGFQCNGCEPQVTVEELVIDPFVFPHLQSLFVCNWKHVRKECDLIVQCVGNKSVDCVLLSRHRNASECSTVLSTVSCTTAS